MDLGSPDSRQKANVRTSQNEKPKIKRDKYISLYTSDLDYLLDTNKINTWICGHIHSNFDFIHNQKQNGTRIVGNQKGKPKDKITDYLKNFVIKI